MTLTKEEFKNKLEETMIKKIENQIFEELKNSPVKGTFYIEKKYQGTGINAGKINRRIINYQVKTFGETIAPRSSDEFRTTTQLKKIAHDLRAERKRQLQGR
jgi:hypothetical protein